MIKKEMMNIEDLMKLIIKTEGLKDYDKLDIISFKYPTEIFLFDSHDTLLEKDKVFNCKEYYSSNDIKKILYTEKIRNFNLGITVDINEINSSKLYDYEKKMKYCANLGKFFVLCKNNHIDICSGKFLDKLKKVFNKNNKDISIIDIEYYDNYLNLSIKDSIRIGNMYKCKKDFLFKTNYISSDEYKVFMIRKDIIITITGIGLDVVYFKCDNSKEFTITKDCLYSHFEEVIL